MFQCCAYTIRIVCVPVLRRRYCVCSSAVLILFPSAVSVVLCVFQCCADPIRPSMCDLPVLCPCYCVCSSAVSIVPCVPVLCPTSIVCVPVLCQSYRVFQCCAPISTMLCVVCVPVLCQSYRVFQCCAPPIRPTSAVSIVPCVPVFDVPCVPVLCQSYRVFQCCAPAVRSVSWSSRGIPLHGPLAGAYRAERVEEVRMIAYDKKERASFRRVL